MKADKPASVDAYLATFPESVQKNLERIRMAVIHAAPKAEETISYGMPAFRYKGKVIIYFAGYKNHIGFYPMPAAIIAFKKELSIYKSSKGAVQFPLDKPLPSALITKMVKYRIAENLQKAKAKKK